MLHSNTFGSTINVTQFVYNSFRYYLNWTWINDYILCSFDTIRFVQTVFEFEIIPYMNKWS